MAQDWVKPCRAAPQLEGGKIEPIHRILGYAAVVAVAVGITWSVVATRTSASGGHRFVRFQVLAVVLIVVTAIAGLGLLIAGAQPKEGLHLVYAAIAIAVLPLARSFVAGTDRRAALATLAAFMVLGFVLYRLFATG